MESGYVLSEAEDRIATITLNRPDSLNAIVSPMWQELEEAVALANRDREVRVIVLKGAGRAFCPGFDFGAQGDVAQMDPQKWDPGADMMGVTNPFEAPVPRFTSLWHSPKPTIAQVHGQRGRRRGRRAARRSVRRLQPAQEVERPSTARSRAAGGRRGWRLDRRQCLSPRGVRLAGC